MPIVGYNISSIVAERRALPAKKININSTPRITSVEDRIVPITKRDTLAIGFEFLTTYSPNIGQIKINGELLYVGKDMKDILTFWKNKRSLPKEVDIVVKNFLFRKCLTLGVNLSEQLQLPPPLMFPMLAPKKDEERTSYIG